MSKAMTLPEVLPARMTGDEWTEFWGRVGEGATIRKTSGGLMLVGMWTQALVGYRGREYRVVGWNNGVSSWVDLREVAA